MYRIHQQIKNIACFILFLTSLSIVHAQTPPDTNTAEGIVSRFYGFVFFTGQSPNFKDMAKVKEYFDSNFYNDLIMLMKISGKTEIVEHQLDFGPFTNAQDNADGFLIKNSINTKANNTIQIPIVFLLRTDAKERWQVTVSLIKMDNSSEWKINDIIYPNNKSLSKLAKEAAQYIKNRHLKEDPDGYYKI